MTDLVPRARRRRPGILGAAIIVVATLGVWTLAIWAELFWEHQHGMRTVILVMASAATGGALLFLVTRRLRPADGISRSFLVAAAVVGGLLALVVPSLVEPPFGQFMDRLGLPLLAPVIAGPLEETVKLAAVAIVARWVAVRSARTGLFIGGAVGIGYAILENIDYEMSATGYDAYLPPSAHLADLVRTTVERSIITPFAHPIWTGIAAAALFAASRGGRLRLTGRAVLGWAVVVVLHSLWDLGPGVLHHLLLPIPVAAVLAGYGWLVLLMVVGTVLWRIIAGRANRPPAPPAPESIRLG